MFPTFLFSEGIIMRFWKAAVAVIAVATLPLFAGPTHAESGVRIGTLNCAVEGGVGLLVGSRRNMTCTFYPSSGHRERYTGRITRVGVDVGFTRKALLSWAVFAPGKLRAGSLAGRYGGVSAKATVGVGLGANVLVGGLRDTIALQPLSVQTQTGLNLAAGVAGLRLRFAGQ
jgi:Protein of unknown function (DUF992)